MHSVEASYESLGQGKNSPIIVPFDHRFCPDLELQQPEEFLEDVGWS